MPEVTDTMLVRIGELEGQLRALESKVRELQTELRGYDWAQSNANAEISLIHHRDLPDEDDA